MLPLILALAAVGAGAGYFGTSKKNRGKKGLRNAALGAVGGATLGIGAGALAGGGAASGLASTGTAGLAGAGSTPIGMAGAVGGTGTGLVAPSAFTAGEGVGMIGGGGALSGGTAGATTMSGGLQASGALGGASTSTATGSGLSGLMNGAKGIASNKDLQKFMLGQMMSGNKDQEQVQTPQYQRPPMTEWQVAPQTPSTAIFSSLPPDVQMQILRQYQQ